jgi:hypothetical protein
MTAEQQRIYQVSEIMEALDLQHEGAAPGETAYGEAAAFLRSQAGHLRQAADTIERLRAALTNLVSAHNGYDHGMGPCICAAHEDARDALSSALGATDEGSSAPNQAPRNQFGLSAPGVDLFHCTHCEALFVEHDDRDRHEARSHK